MRLRYTVPRDDISPDVRRAGKLRILLYDSQLYDRPHCRSLPIKFARREDGSRLFPDGTHELWSSSDGKAATAGLFTSSRRHLLVGLSRRIPPLLRKRVRDVILVNVAHVHRGLDADLLGSHDLDVVEPHVGVETAFGGFLTHLRDVSGACIVAVSYTH